MLRDAPKRQRAHHQLTHVPTAQDRARAGSGRRGRRAPGRDTRTQRPGEQLRIPAGRETRCEAQGRGEPGRVGHPHAACGGGPESSSGAMPRFRTALFQLVVSLSHNTGITSRIRPRHHLYQSLGSSTAAGIRGMRKSCRNPMGTDARRSSPTRAILTSAGEGLETPRAEAPPRPAPTLCTPTDHQYPSLPSSPP